MVANETTLPEMPATVAEVFDTYDDDVRESLLELRKLVLSTAGETAGVGSISEGLRWGEPAFLTSKTKSGSTIRLAPTPNDSDHDYAMYFICHTNLVEHFEVLFGNALTYEGNRALLFAAGQELPVDELRTCIEMALTYHLNTD